MDRHELRKLVIDSGILSEEQISVIEKEGCRVVIANGLCVSPFSGYKYYIISRYADDIIKGLKILKSAVDAEYGEIFVPANNQAIVDRVDSYIKKAPNIFMSKIKDFYPRGLLEIFSVKLKYFSVKSPYYPGKEGVLIVPVEDLLKICFFIEHPESADLSPIVFIADDQKYFLWVKKNTVISELLKRLKIKTQGFIIRGDLIRGQAISHPAQETVGNSSQFFVVSDTGICISECICCGRCNEVCPVNLKTTHSMCILYGKKGVIPFKHIVGCVGCGLCSYFCPGMKK
ncbi:hypothetical protein ACFLTD_03570 [Elusimicrobiota bacterium]